MPYVPMEVNKPLTNIFNFQTLPKSDIDKYHQHLKCPECGGKAYYRKKH